MLGWRWLMALVGVGSRWLALAPPMCQRAESLPERVSEPTTRGHTCHGLQALVPFADLVRD